MDEQEAWEKLAAAQVATLATIGENGPHQVPITFVVLNGAVVTAVDHKPKTTQRLKRLDNIEATGIASVLVHHYSDDWDELWWVRVDGPARVHPALEFVPGAADALFAKYQQYAQIPPSGPAIEIEIDTIRSWDATWTEDRRLRTDDWRQTT